MRSFRVLLLLLLFHTQLMSMTFKEAMSSIKTHRAVEVISSQSLSLAETGEAKGSWGDATLKIAAKNYPIDSLDPDKTPMTGIDIVLSQQIPLTSKYSDLSMEYKHLSEAEGWKAKNKLESLRSTFWTYLISIRKLNEEMAILKENLSWLENIIKVSQDLYSTGGKSQQALLELKIRKSELKSMVQTKEFEVAAAKEMLKYILGDSDELDLSTVPWKLLETSSSKLDTLEKSMESDLKSKQFAMMAMSKSRMPDLTISIGYTKRSDIDDNGDFVSLSAAMPIPSSSLRYADFRKSIYSKTSSELALADYRQEKAAQLAKLNVIKKKIELELEILKSESIIFAENAMQITTKSYQLGVSSYIELLQSELKLQNLKMKKVEGTAHLRETNLAIKTLLGEKLYE